MRDYTLKPEEIPIVEECIVPAPERDAIKARVAERLAALNATLVAHYYVSGDIQDLAEETGGFVSDSLEMARFGRDCDSDTLIVSGVRFMGETAKILSPAKRVFMPTLAAECSLDLGCPPDEFAGFLRRTPRADGGGLCEYLGARQSAVGLGGHQQLCVGYRAPPESAGREDPLGARPALGPLHTGTDGRRYAAVERCLCGA